VTKIDWDDFKQLLGDRLREIRGGKWWIPSFVKFQYGQLKNTEKPGLHNSVIKALEGHGLFSVYQQWYSEATAVPPGTHPGGSPVPQGKGIGKGEGKGTEEGEVVGDIADLSDPEILRSEVDAIYHAYPRKTSPLKAKHAISKALKEIPAAELLQKTLEYAAAVARWPEDKLCYVPHTATWFNGGKYLEDPKEWNRNGVGSIVSFPKRTPDNLKGVVGPVTL
jgi:hypothetical protein